METPEFLKKTNWCFFTFTHNLTCAVTWAVGLCDKSGAPRAAVASHRSFRVAWVNLKFPIRSSSVNSNSVAFVFIFSNIVMETAVDVTNTNRLWVSIFLSARSREWDFTRIKLVAIVVYWNNDFAKNCDGKQAVVGQSWCIGPSSVAPTCFLRPETSWHVQLCGGTIVDCIGIDMTRANKNHSLVCETFLHFSHSLLSQYHAAFARYLI